MESNGIDSPSKFIVIADKKYDSRVSVSVSTIFLLIGWSFDVSRFYLLGNDFLRKYTDTQIRIGWC